MQSHSGCISRRKLTYTIRCLSKLFNTAFAPSASAFINISWVTGTVMASTGQTLAQRPHLQHLSLSTVYILFGNVILSAGQILMQSLHRAHFASSHSMISPMRKCILPLPCSHVSFRGAKETP